MSCRLMPHALYTHAMYSHALLPLDAFVRVAVVVA